MKTCYTTLAALFVAATSIAQPAITGGNVPPIGYTRTLSTGTAAAPPSATGGANVTWDYSGITLPTVGTMTVIDPATGPFISQFSGTNFSFRFDISGQQLFYYYASSATKLESLATDVTSASTGGNTYTNGRSALDFPISYMGSTTDTYQKNGGSVQTTTNTYDGYGTLKTPYGTYNNVVRIKQVNSAFPNPDYMWFQTSPLLNIFSYISNNNSYFSFDGATTGINEESSATRVSITPNPATGRVMVSILGQGSLDGKLSIYSSDGRLMMSLASGKAGAQIDVSAWAGGLYFYQYKATSGAIANGRFTVK